MKLSLLHTLVLLAVLLQSGAASDGDSLCVPVFVCREETAVINCRIKNVDQHGVYLYRKRNESIVEEMMYYFKDGTFSPEPSFKHLLQTNQNLGNFSVSLSNVSEHDSGVYWCKFNKLDRFTFSDRTCLLVQSGQKTMFLYKEKKCQQGNFMYLGVIGGLSLIILVLLFVPVKLCLCYDRGHYTPKQQQQQPCSDVYEVMRGNTERSLINPAYESSQRRTRADLGGRKM